MATLLQDLRYALRVSWKTPAFTAVAVLTLALGIGTTTAMFSLLNQALLMPLPYAQPQQLVHIDWRSPSRGRRVDALNGRQAFFLQQNNTVFDAVAELFAAPGCNLVSGGQAQYAEQAAVSSGFFRTFAVQPFLGRTFLAADAVTKPAQVAVVSYGLWKNQLGGDPQAVGRSIKCNGLSYTVIGVLPATFSFPEEPADVWIPDRMENYVRDSGSNYWMVARIKSGLNIAQAQQEMTALSGRFRSEFPPNFSWTNRVGPDGVAHLVPLREWRLGDNDRTTLLLLFGAVTLVLLIAAANVAGLILARASGRARELAARLALGATRARLIRQLLTESLLLSLAGGATGLLLAAWSLQLLNAVVLQRFSQIGSLHINLTVAFFALGVSVLAAALAGTAPALQVTRIDLQQSLKQGEHGSGGAHQHGLRKALVVAEVALALLLLVGSSLLARSFLMLRDVSPGLDPRGIDVAQLSFGSARYQTSAGISAFQRDVLARVRAVPGVTAAATVSSVPLRRDLNLSMKTGPCSGESVSYRAISPGYFALMGIPLHRGRAFAEGEAAPVAIVNEAAARLCWPGQDAMATQFSMWSDIPRQVVGIVGDTRDYGLSQDATPIVWVPQWQVPNEVVGYQNSNFYWSVVFRAASSAGLNQSIERAVRDVDPEQSVMAIAPLTTILEKWLAPSRLLLQLMGLFAGLALLLTAVGLYGVLSYYVTQRSREIGIRMALGAERSHVLRIVLAEGMALVAAGAVIGILGSLAATRLLKSVLFGVKPLDPLTFAAAVVFLFAVALLAGYLPARRATRVDPIVVLRYE